MRVALPEIADVAVAVGVEESSITIETVAFDAAGIWLYGGCVAGVICFGRQEEQGGAHC
jgi:hypothetical protein